MNGGSRRAGSILVWSVGRYIEAAVVRNPTKTAVGIAKESVLNGRVLEGMEIFY